MNTPDTRPYSPENKRVQKTRKKPINNTAEKTLARLQESPYIVALPPELVRHPVGTDAWFKQQLDKFLIRDKPYSFAVPNGIADKEFKTYPFTLVKQSRFGYLVNQAWLGLCGYNITSYDLATEAGITKLRDVFGYGNRSNRTSLTNLFKATDTRLIVAVKGATTRITFGGWSEHFFWGVTVTID